MCKWLAAMAGAVFGFLAAGPSFAEDFPTRPITMIVPFPGRATDTLAPVLGERMGAILGQPVIIENAGGAAGSLGVARAGSAGDGNPRFRSRMRQRFRASSPRTGRCDRSIGAFGVSLH